MGTVNRQGKYLSLEDARIWHDTSTDTFKVTSSDPILGGGGITLSIKRGSRTDDLVRHALVSAGILSMTEPSLDDRRLERPIAFSDYTRDLIKERVPGVESLSFSLGRRVDNSSLDFSFVETGQSHLLVCGGTNSGKIDLIRSMMRQLGEANGAEELNIWLVDDGGDYAPMFNFDAVHEIVVDGVTEHATVDDTLNEKVSALLDRAVHEMNYRYQMMKEHPRRPNSLRAARDLARRGDDADSDILHAPFIVIVVDLALCQQANNDAFLRLLNKARSAGIFLVLTTWDDQLSISNPAVLEATHPIGMVGSSTTSQRLLGAPGMEDLPLVAGLTPVGERLTPFRTYDYPDSGVGLHAGYSEEAEEHADFDLADLMEEGDDL